MSSIGTTMNSLLIGEGVTFGASMGALYPVSLLGDGETDPSNLLGGSDSFLREPSAETLALAGASLIAEGSADGSRFFNQARMFAAAEDSGGGAKLGDRPPFVIVPTPISAEDEDEHADIPHPSPTRIQAERVFSELLGIFTGGEWSAKRNEIASKVVAALSTDGRDLHTFAILLEGHSETHPLLVPNFLGLFNDHDKRIFEGAIRYAAVDVARTFGLIEFAAGDETVHFGFDDKSLAKVRDLRRKLCVLQEIMPANDPRTGRLRPYRQTLDKKIRSIKLEKALREKEESNRLQGEKGYYYEVGDRIGSGGMAAVNRGKDLMRGGKPVAVKVFHPTRGDPAADSFHSRFVQEARILLELDHPALIRGIDFGTDHDRDFIIMELVEGKSAADTLKLKGPFSAARVCEIATQVCFGLEWARRVKGLVHRDVKPSNILIDETSGNVKLGDFGIAKLLGVNTALTMAGQMPGTINYTAPESGRQDVASEELYLMDIYSLGVTMYEMAAGHVPFDFGGDVIKWANHFHIGKRMPLKRPPNVPDSLWRVIKKMMSVEPADRYQSYTEIVTELKKVLEELAAVPSDTVVVSGVVETLDGSDIVEPNEEPAPLTEPAVQRDIHILLAMLERLYGNGGHGLEAEEMRDMDGEARAITESHGTNPPSGIMSLAGLVLQRVGSRVKRG